MSKGILDDSNKLVEKLSKYVIFFVMHLSVPCFMWPKFFLSYYNYYFNADPQSDVFQLPHPMW